jgi:hypothetical protein
MFSPPFPFLGLLAVVAFEACQVAPESLCDQMLETVIRALNALSVAIDLFAGNFVLFELAEVLFETSEAVLPQRLGLIYVA